ncbi:SDR family NAD(P)-dependent oxidoreductase [Bradymonas sediminis]|uniref:Short-chain dehydrogenase n=1 Tax=Bradymonas sediminis TaxID=1548548 RepID=A0A2Z4FLZ9_9DELT|nr:SDR family NAD(P)-dependent oxidoreductase [Bradymonas sediminis]AWV89835.1 short-chain dehydrogenase [Bradymonas sediminis]TDP76418.1 hypothetical protein DFR33_10247 [Bradymonas sediminis]
MNIAIVTGASSGLGWEYAKQLAPRAEVDEVWLLARREERLLELAGDLIGAEGRVFAVDLCDPTQLAEFFEKLEGEQPTISWLVNCAGYGKMGRFVDIDVEAHLGMVDLNIRALTEITQRALPYCTRGSKIVQVASSAGFSPMGNFAVYAASKAYVLHFANALSAELAADGITVTAVCPGPVATEFIEIANMEALKAGAPDFTIAQAPDVVRKSIADARKGRMTSVYGATMKAWGALSGVVPRRLTSWATARFRAH